MFGVSYDAPATNRAFADRYNLPFLLLSDADRSLARAVGAAIPLLPFPKRISYLVGGNGSVIKAYPGVKPSRHAAEVLADARTLLTAPG